MLRIRSAASAFLLVAMATGVFLMPRIAVPSWESVSAQAIPKAGPGDRIYLKIEGLEGEASETDHTGDIQLRSFTWSETGTTDTSTKVQVKEFHGVYAFDKASPLLMRKAATRERTAKAVLVMRNPLGQDYLKVTMNDLVFTSFLMEGTTATGKPTVSFDFRFSKIDMEYRAQLYNGGLGPAVKAGFEWKGF